MKAKFLALALAAIASGPAHPFDLTTPDAGLTASSIAVPNPDEKVETLGNVEVFIDLAASHDSLLELEVRRSNLKLPDGRAFTAFGVHKDAGIIVLAAGDVANVSIASVRTSGDARETLVLFHGNDGRIIAPAKSDLAVYDLSYRPLTLDYAPLKPPGGTTIPVHILLDSSGSMSAHMGTVVRATQDFMRKLPVFTRCAVTVFNDQVRTLTAADPTRRVSCPQSASTLYAPIKPSGATALFRALEGGFAQDDVAATGPVITVAVTDGMNTESYLGGVDRLKALKSLNRAKLFVFWAGAYDPSYLSGLADLEVTTTANLDVELERFFRSLGISISGLQTLRIDASSSTP